MVRRFVLSVTLASLAAVLLAIAPAGAGTVRASSCVQISQIYFNSPGSDTGGNASLNAEWVQVKNKCSVAKALTGWTLRDAANHVYAFGTFSLRAGASVKVHTGSGTNTATDRYWRSRWYIWNNTGDTAVLKNSSGTTQDSCRYSGSGSSVYC